MTTNAATMTVSGPLGTVPTIKGPIPGPEAKKVIEVDERLTSPSYTRDFPLAVKRARGCTVEDMDGNLFLDFAAGIAVCSTGHAHPKVVEAIKKQADEFIHICGSDFYYPSMSDLCDRFDKITPISGKKRVLLQNSGTEVVEAAMKLSRYSTGRKWIIGFYGAFHGRTMGSLSLTCSKRKQRSKFGPLIPMVTHVDYGDVGAIESKLFNYQMAPDEVAAVFVEPLQGEGGYVVPPPDFMPKLRELCDRHGILLVCDEIQSGAGRTGKWFCCEHYGVEPDMILTAKGIGSGMPIGALIAKESVMNWTPGSQGSTYGGNPLACASAVATIDLIESEYLAKVPALGDHLMAGLKSLEAKHACLASARGMGLMCAIDVVSPDGRLNPTLREKILLDVFHRGGIFLPCGFGAIRFCPALCITKEEIDLGLHLIDQAAAACG